MPNDGIAKTAGAGAKGELADTYSWVNRLGGRFVVFDGPDGSGKSTQHGRFADWVEGLGVKVCRVREPGGTAISEQIRKLLLSRDHEEMVPGCEVLLYMASRAQLVAEQIRPALGRGELVLADRFISSTLAYQGAAGGVGAEDILMLGRFAVGDCWPDLVVVFDVDGETARERLTGKKGGRGKKKDSSHEVSLFADRMEAKQAGDGGEGELVRRGYLEQAAGDAERYRVIDARGGADEVFGGLVDVVGEVAGGW